MTKSGTFVSNSSEIDNEERWYTKDTAWPQQLIFDFFPFHLTQASLTNQRVD